MNWPLPKFVERTRIDPDIALEKFINEKAQTLLNGGHVYLYDVHGRIRCTYTADTILQEECLYQDGDYALLLKDPAEFGRKIQARMKEEIREWCEEMQDDLMEGPDND